MKNTLSLWQLCGYAFTSIAGTLLHFLFEWTNESRIAALFSAVNESTWEHMKLLFFPMLLFSVIESRFIGKEHEGFWCAKLAGIFTGLAVIPALYYTYTGALGVSTGWFNIAIFFIAAAISYILESHLLTHGKPACNPVIPKVLLFITAVMFFVFTFAPPKIPIFGDPITGLYGISM